MPQPLAESLTGGLVTARHPGLLREGELQTATDCVYRERDPAIWRAPGRTVFNSTTLGTTAVKGLASLAFDSNHTNQLLAHTGTILSAADLTTITGTFAEIGGPGQVAGTITGGTTFTATAGSPFLATAVGATITGSGIPAGTTIVAVLTPDGNGHYAAVTLSLTSTNATITATLSFGLILGLENNGTETLEVAQWQGNYYAWFGAGAPYRIGWRPRPTTTTGGSLTDALIARPMGLNPVISPFTAAVVTSYTAPSGVAVSSCSWSSVLGTGFYWFIITEIYAPGGDVTAAERDPLLAGEIIESAYLAPDPTASNPAATKGRPRYVSITNVATQGVTITFPSITNAGIDRRVATNWGVYMYGPTLDASTPPSLAQFRRVGTPKITDTTFTLTNTPVAPQLKYPTTRTTDDGKPEMEGPANALGAPDRLFAYAKSGSSTDSPGVQDGVEKLGGWSFDTSGSYATAAIVGIEVQVTGFANASGNASDKAGYYVHIDTSSKHTPQFFNAFGTPYGTQYFGGPMDTLGVAWVIADLSTITVTVGKTGTGARQRLGLDAVGLKVYFNGNNVTLDGPAYRVVTYRDQIGLTVSDPANLPPPNCSTGDVWNGSLVLNDLSQEGAIRYSLPLVPESFPKPYVLQPSTRTRSKVTFIRALNQILFVGFQNETKRINYLPRETDTDFQQGIAHEDLSTDHGVPGPLAGVKFDFPGMGSVIIYASTNGVYLTNGITTRPVNLDLDWANTVNINNLATCVFRVYTREKWLVLYYNPAGATHSRNTRALVFSYAADKIKEGGMLPCTGPITVSGRSSVESVIGSVPYLFTGHETNGTVYVEDQGTTQAASYQVHNSADTLTDAPIQPVIRTRRIYLGGLDRDSRETRVFLLYSAYGSTITATSTTTVNSTTVTSSNAFGSVTVGMRVTGTGIDPGTIVTAKASDSSITISQAANATGAGVTLSFDTGTIAASVYGADLRESVSLLGTSYDSMVAGDLLSLHLDHIRRGLELQIEKVVLPSGASADLSTNMRIHQFVIMGIDGGYDQSRSTG